ncbi:RsiV family protein [Aquimarina brevivitae]|uniref:Uncharacterized protein DUF3298 n=1 Tax=Aquimarina brevivitae TaxID=323412 RepID=A0A4Q7PI77_9FLAO|nr:RsiV family protein [Aquimarina brevivitae]RZS99678.1 uncharacterized protein DUF3298 [Aquimarina brevivitae]
MKYYIVTLLALTLVSCGNQQSDSKQEEHKEEPKLVEQDSSNKTENYFSEESLEYDQEKTKAIKKEILIKAKDDKLNLQDIIVDKSFFKESDFYIIDYRYPNLNEANNKQYATFNDYVQKKYLNIEATENDLLDDKEMLCDSINGAIQKDKRYIDYKVYQSKNDLLSVLIYKENYYAGMKNSTYSFDCINYDLEKGEFIEFDDFFKPNSQSVVFNKINEIITAEIEKGNLYYNCWEISQGDFEVYQNNFVIKDDAILYYFDDCVICPSYTGTYYVSIPIKELLPIIKAYNNEPVVS